MAIVILELKNIEKRLFTSGSGLKVLECLSHINNCSYDYFFN